MCIAVKITDYNVLDYGKELNKLKIILGRDSYKEILKLNNGKHPEIVRTHEIIFHTQDSDERFKSSIYIEGDDINFAYTPIDLLPGPKDQNLFRIFFLNKNDITDWGISIPDGDEFNTINKVSWKDVIKYFEVVES